MIVRQAWRQRKLRVGLPIESATVVPVS